MIALDLRGFGWTEAPRDGYEKEKLAADVLAVLDALGIERVKLSATTGAAGSASCSACGRRERFERYLALNIVPPWAEPGRCVPHSGASGTSG